MGAKVKLEEWMMRFYETKGAKGVVGEELAQEAKVDATDED